MEHYHNNNTQYREVNVSHNAKALQELCPVFRHDLA